MKNILIVICLVLFSTSSAFSQVLQFNFVGLSISSIKSDFDIKTQRDVALGIKLGTQNLKWRAFIEAKKDHRGYKELFLETDYLFDTVKVKRIKFKPYIGTSVGYYDHKLNNKHNALFGLNTGLIFNINNEMDLDFGIAHKIKRKSDDFNNVRTISVSVHYFF